MSTERRLIDAAFYLSFFLLSFGLALAIDPNSVQSAKAWFFELPAAALFSRFGFSEFPAFFGEERPSDGVLLPALVAITKKVLSVDFPRAAQILMASSSALIVCASYRFFARQGNLIFSWILAVALFLSPFFLSTSLQTGSDLLFCAALMIAASFVMSDRPRALVWIFPLAILSKPTAVFLLPAALVLVRARLYALLLVVLSSAALYSNLLVYENLGLGRFEGAQLWRSAPIEFFRHAYAVGSMRGVLSAFVVGLGLVTLLVAAKKGSRFLLVTLVLTTLGLIAQFALRPFELDAAIPLYVFCFLLGGFTLLRTLSSPALQKWRKWMAQFLIVATSSALLLNLRAFAETKPVPEYERAQVEAKKLLEKMERAVSYNPSQNRTIKILGCENQNFRITNFWRAQKPAGVFECVGWRFGKPISWHQVDFAIVENDASTDDALEQRIRKSSVVVWRLLEDTLVIQNLVYGVYADPVSPFVLDIESTKHERLKLGESADSNLWALSEKTWVFEPKSPEPGLTKAQTGTVSIQRGDILVSSFVIAPGAELKEGLTFSHREVGRDPETSSLTVKKMLSEFSARSAAHQCNKEECLIRFEIEVPKNESAPIRIRDLDHYVVRSRTNFRR